MKSRIAIWSGAGFLIATWWAIYAFARPPIQAEPAMWMLARLIYPIAFLSHCPIRLSFVLLANAATYGLVGFAVEGLRRHMRHAL